MDGRQINLSLRVGEARTRDPFTAGGSWTSTATYTRNRIVSRTVVKGCAVRGRRIFQHQTPCRTVVKKPDSTMASDEERAATALTAAVRGAAARKAGPPPPSTGFDLMRQQSKDRIGAEVSEDAKKASVVWGNLSRRARIVRVACRQRRCCRRRNRVSSFGR